jgi:rare lipoprotein A
MRLGHVLKAWAACLATGCWLCACGPADTRRDSPQSDAAGPAQTGKASYYGTHDAGEPTASGVPFEPNAMTAASRTLPFGTKAKVTNKETGQSAHVTVTDRGPFAKGRILDVSPKAADRLGMKASGVVEVRVEPVDTPESAR